MTTPPPSTPQAEGEPATLLPCPFCGESATIVTYASGTRIGIRCKNATCGCALRLGLPGETEDEARTAWNTRTP